MARTLLTLDLATRVGWAVGCMGSDTVGFGAYQLPSADAGEFGRQFHAFDMWLSDMITTHDPSHIVMEAVLADRAPGQNAARTLLGLGAITELVAYRREVDVMEVHVSTVRKHFCGSGHAKKDDVGFQCRERGWMVADHNAADALAVLSYARHALGIAA